MRNTSTVRSEKVGSKIYIRKTQSAGLTAAAMKWWVALTWDKPLFCGPTESYIHRVVSLSTIQLVSFLFIMTQIAKLLLHKLPAACFAALKWLFGDGAVATKFISAQGALVNGWHCLDALLNAPTAGYALISHI